MHIPLSPSSLSPPFSAYSHGVEVPGNQKLVFCSGQLGISKDGLIPDGCAAQAELCFQNIEAILAEAGLGLDQVIRLNAYVIGRDHMQPYMDVRNARFSHPLPASTLIIVGGFSRPEFVVEIEAIAAGPAGSN